MSIPRKRSVTIHGHRTSFSLEDEFYSEIERLAKADNRAAATLIAEIDTARTRDMNLSSALRLHVLRMLKADRSGSSL